LTSKLKSAAQALLALLPLGWQQAWRWVVSAKVGLLQSALGDLHVENAEAMKTIEEPRRAAL
jgi:hypothetical protein